MAEKSVRTFDRFMKQAGLLTSGARGVNAPDMTPRDAARMTIALLSTDLPSKAVERVQRFAAMPFVAQRSTGAVPSSFKDGITTLEQVLTDHFATNTNELFPLWYVEIHENAKKALIIDNDQNAGFEAVFSDHASTDRHELFGIRRARGIAAAEMMELWVPLHLSVGD